MYTPANIGTPLSSSAIRVMLLGSGELGKEMTIALQRLGVEVHAVDRYPVAPAHQVAHQSYVIDMTDYYAVTALADRIKPHFIVPEIEAVATQALADIEAEGNITVIPTARAAHLTMNREGIRRLAAERLGLPTSKYEFASTFEEFTEAVRRIGFPCVVKPVVSSAGKGQSVCRTDDDIPGAWEYAIADDRGDKARVIVEAFIDFDYEITLLTVRSIDPTTDKNATWFCEPIGHRQVEGAYVESWQPMPMSATALENARSVAARITGALGGRGVFGVELFVAGDDVYFSEVSPRPHDTGMVTLASQRFSEFELHARAILGLPIDTTLISPGASSVIYGQSDGPVKFSGIADAMAVPETDIRLFGKPTAGTKRRMGVALSTGESIEEARVRATLASHSVKVNEA